MLNVKDLGNQFSAILVVNDRTKREIEQECIDKMQKKKQCRTKNRKETGIVREQRKEVVRIDHAPTGEERMLQNGGGK